MVIRREILWLIALFFCTTKINAQRADSSASITDSLLETFELMPDDGVLQMIDQSLSTVYSKTFMTCAYPEKRDSLVVVDVDFSEAAARMGELNKMSPFELVYNPYVEAFIKLYLVKKRDVTEKILGVAPYYYPIFEEELAKTGLPLELKYLPIVESALNPRAKSRAGAMGLWQFMYRTGRMYGLNVNSYYDERMDPIRATTAACQFLSALYDMYGDWNLVIAAYNCGPGNVNKAIRRSGGKRDFWEIRRWLPRETRGYVPAFMAVNYVMNHWEDHDLQPLKPEVAMLATDTVYVCNKISFESVSNTLDLSQDWLRYFNPMYKMDIIPESKEKLNICLPMDKVGLFMVNEDSIYAFHRKKEKILEEKGIAENKTPEGQEVIHKVRSGEVLGLIARRYGCTVTQIKEWNNMWTSRIYPGQRLRVYSNKQTAVATTVEKKPEPQPKQEAVITGKYRYHTIQPGDTLWDIAKKYKEVTVNDLKRLNSGIDFRKLKPGDKIKVSKVG